jgi:hypothetical protein
MQLCEAGFVCQSVVYNVTVLRLALRPYVALLLLLCLTRTLLPEAWVLALHPHEHTTEEPAFAPAAKRQPGKALLTTKHTHCQTEQFYDVAYQLAQPVVVPLPQRGPTYRPLAAPATLACSAAALRRTALRGPPQA